MRSRMRSMGIDALPSTALFAKQPAPGAVKTRLTPPLTPEEAAAVAGAMLDDLAARFGAVPGRPLDLVVAPAGAEGWFRRRYPACRVTAQVGAGLGERLAAWFQGTLQRHPHAVVFGGDCPALPRSLVERAHARLARGADAVFAPDPGGGYALVGLSRPAPEVFGVTMSRPDNLERTLAVARGRGLSVELLEPCLDVDRVEDLHRLVSDHAAGSSADPDHPTTTVALARRILDRL